MYEMFVCLFQICEKYLVKHGHNKWGTYLQTNIVTKHEFYQSMIFICITASACIPDSVCITQTLTTNINMPVLLIHQVVGNHLLLETRRHLCFRLHFWDQRHPTPAMLALSSTDLTSSHVSY